MTEGLDIRELLELVATHDGREITLTAVAAWHEQAVRGGWNRQDSIDAVLDFYAQVPPACWPGSDRPRPVLPVDITEHHQAKGTAR